ncbi:MAG: DUF1579 family protein [Armatimonadetes bacterium]|nr:DUF1579 family protein [Armatimonadota bacterium]
MSTASSIWNNAAAIAAAILLQLATSIPTNAQQEIPKVSDQIKRIITIAKGEWAGNATITMGDQTLRFPLSMSNKVISGGWGLMSTVHGTIPGMGEYHETDMFGYDAGRDALHLFSVTSFGETHDHSGKWTNDKRLEFRYEGVADGAPLLEEIVAEFTTPRELSISSTVMIGGATAVVFKAVFKKKA